MEGVRDRNRRGRDGQGEVALSERETPTADDHIKAAQKAGERRLAIAVSFEMGESDASDLDPPGSFDELCGPYCGCDTCIVREVLDAAWPHILAAGDALIEENRALKERLTLALEERR